MNFAKKLAVLGAPFVTAAMAFAEGEQVTYDVDHFWGTMNIDFGSLISQGATIIGVIMIAIVSVSLTFKVVMTGLGYAKKAFGRS